MFAAFSLQPWVEGTRSTLTRLPSDIMEELEPFLDRDSSVRSAPDRGFKETIKIIAVSVVALLLSVALFFNIRAAVKEIGQSESHTYYKLGAEWMKEHVPQGSATSSTF
jgi:hypothetical protein